MKQNKIAIIILNWNGKYLLEECLVSIEKQHYDNFNIILVDNGSNDGSIEFVKEKFPKVNLIELKENTGFAKGNNIGICKAFEDKDTKYIALLNNDAIADKDWLLEMAKIIEQDEKIGSIAPKIRKYYIKDEFDSMGMKIRYDGGGFNNHMNDKDIGQFDSELEVFGPTGCSCLYKREMLEDIVLNDNDYFDSDFFAYCEDLDVCWRARIKGWKCLVAPKSVIYHKGSESFQVYSFIKSYHSHRNRLFVIFKNYPQKLLFKALYRFFLNYIYSAQSISKGKGYSAKTKEKIGILNIFRMISKGWLSFLLFLPKTIKKRHTIQKGKLVNNEDIKEWFIRFGEDRNLSFEEYKKQ